MRPAELLRRLNRLATMRGWQITITEGGSHTKVLPRHSADLKTGTFRGILKQLGLTEDDLEV